ncbi:MAG: DNA mismatch repair endonuclease MutL [Clostridia bacterium]|nr:DNA mismatch repair endonuclease MutL [Clostridia bacterium]
MSKINLLSSEVYNRISAGEVIEIPASAVKELVENAIDAGATAITVEIVGGGISSINIKDNGCGIEKSELKKALLPHATSKIKSVDDLDCISTLGFRGEALASIASVSKITIKSKPISQEFGAQISYSNNAFSEISDTSLNNGTEIKVDNLFYNAPVRAKFLRSEKSEEGEITAVMSRFILGHPEISFKYIANGKVVLQSFGEGEESAFVCVYGASSIDDCFYIKSEKNGIIISGYIGKHYFTKSNRGHQTVFLNGRYIVNNTVSSAISNAYSSYLMKRQYPFYVLNITVPTDAVDVNVHPNKIDVRFNNNQIIYSSIYSVISKALDGTNEALNIIVDKKTDNNQVKSTENIIHYDRHNSINTPKNFVFNDSGAKSLDVDYNKIDKKEEKKDVEDIFALNKAYLEKLEEEKKNKTVNIKEENQTFIKIDKKLSLIGQALNTFLIFEDGEDLYFIDQHAAHERILFDKFSQEVKNASVVSQPLLVPYILFTDNNESDFLEEKLNVLNDMGFIIDEFGTNTYKISSVPAFLTEINLKKFFNELFFDIDILKKITVNDLLKDKIAQKACKSAIKSGDKMSEDEISILMEKLNNNLGLKCPHGRPIAIKITRTEIDKWFKRIV